MSKKYTPAIFQPTLRPSWGGVMSYISAEEKADILEAIISYPKSTNIKSHFWEETVKPDLEMQYESFVNTCLARGRGARNYWESKDINKDNLSYTKDNNKDNSLKDKDKNKDKDKDKNIFKKPKIEEIKNYCVERNNNINAEQFFNFYESKGWKVGNTPMKDWKAAVRTWESKEKPKKQEIIEETVFIDEHTIIDETMPEFNDMTYDECCRAFEWLQEKMYCQSISKSKFVEIVRKFKRIK